MIRHIKHLPARARSKRISPLQGSLDLRIDRQKEIQGIGMGVLSDGTPFLTQRGLARLCGVQNAHIGTMGSEWNESPVKPRIATIRDMLARRGVFLDTPYIQVMDGERVIYAYPDSFVPAVHSYDRSKRLYQRDGQIIDAEKTLVFQRPEGNGFPRAGKAGHYDYKWFHQSPLSTFACGCIRTVLAGRRPGASV